MLRAKLGRQSEKWFDSSRASPLLFMRKNFILLFFTYEVHTSRSCNPLELCNSTRCEHYRSRRTPTRASMLPIRLHIPNLYGYILHARSVRQSGNLPKVSLRKIRILDDPPSEDVGYSCLAPTMSLVGVWG